MAPKRKTTKEEVDVEMKTEPSDQINLFSSALATDVRVKSEPLEQINLPGLDLNTNIAIEFEPVEQTSFLLVKSSSRVYIKTEPHDLGASDSTSKVKVKAEPQLDVKSEIPAEQQHPFNQCYGRTLVGNHYVVIGGQDRWKQNAIRLFILKCGGILHNLQKLQRLQEPFDLTIIQIGVEEADVPKFEGRESRVIDQETLLKEVKGNAKIPVSIEAKWTAKKLEMRRAKKAAKIEKFLLAKGKVSRLAAKEEKFGRMEKNEEKQRQAGEAGKYESNGTRMFNSTTHDHSKP